MRARRVAQWCVGFTIVLAFGILGSSPHILRNVLYSPENPATVEAIEQAAMIRRNLPPAATVVEGLTTRAVRREWDHLRGRLAGASGVRLRSLTVTPLGAVGITVVTPLPQTGGSREVRIVDLHSDDDAHVVAYVVRERDDRNPVTNEPQPTFRLGAVDPSVPEKLLRDGTAAGLAPSDLASMRLGRSTNGVLSWSATWLPFGKEPVIRYADAAGAPITVEQAARDLQTPG